MANEDDLKITKGSTKTYTYYGDSGVFHTLLTCYNSDLADHRKSQASQSIATTVSLFSQFILLLRSFLSAVRHRESRSFLVLGLGRGPHQIRFRKREPEL